MQFSHSRPYGTLGYCLLARAMVVLDEADDDMFLIASLAQASHRQ